MKIYRTSKYNIEIEEIEAERITENRIYFAQGADSRKWAAINSHYEQYHKTIEDAVEYLFSRVTDSFKYHGDMYMKTGDDLKTILLRYKEIVDEITLKESRPPSNRITFKNP